MAEATENVSQNTTELAGKYKIIYTQLTGTTNTDDYVEIDGIDTVDLVVASLDEVTADSMTVEADVDGTTSNRINVEIFESDGTTCSQNATNINIIAVGH